MPRLGLIEVLGSVASVLLLALGAREFSDASSFRSGARPLDVEITEVLFWPAQRSFHYVVRASDQGRELELTLPGQEGSRRSPPKPWNKVGDRTRVLYNPGSQPTARWEGHLWDGSLVFLGLGVALPALIVSANLLERWAQGRRRRPSELHGRS